VHSAPDPARPFESYANKIASLEATVQKLQQENEDLEAQNELFEENKELDTRVNKRKIDQLGEETDGLTLKHYPLDYKNRQGEMKLADQRKESEYEITSRDGQITRLDDDKKVLQSKIEEFETRLSRMAEDGAKQPSLDNQKLSAKDEQLGEARVGFAELESSNAECISDGPNRFAYL
jgi:exonuclease VII small subunit